MSHPIEDDEGREAAAHAALFEQMVAGHGRMVLTFLGRLPNPHSGEHEAPNLEAAKIFIDQLDMLRAKTRGNLSAAEERLIGSTLETVHAAFEAVAADGGSGA
jgi:hypothetical protein